MLNILQAPDAGQFATEGVITYYKDRKLFGFVKTEDYGDVFIHAKRGFKLVVTNKLELELAGLDFTSDDVLIKPPMIGDKIILVGAQLNPDRGPAAVRWVNCSDRITEALAQQQLDNPYYEVYTCPSRGVQLGGAKLLWSGRDLEQLRSLYPVGPNPITDHFYIHNQLGERVDPR